MQVQGRSPIFTFIAAVAIAAASLVPGSASAQQPPVVRFFVDVVHVSDQGTHVDPGLEPVQKSFAANKIQYTSFRKLSGQTVEVTRGKPVVVALPNGKQAKFDLEKLEQDAAQVKISIPPVSTTLTLGREGNVYAHAGKHDKGELVLVVSPVTDDKRRKEEK